MVVHLVHSINTPGRDADMDEPTTPSRATTAHRKRLPIGVAAAQPRRILGVSTTVSQTAAAESPKSKMRNKTQNTEELR